MKSCVEFFDSGWIGVNIALRPDETDRVIERLRGLKGGTVEHFHLRATDCSGERGLADVEISLQGAEEDDNMVV